MPYQSKDLEEIVTRLSKMLAGYDDPTWERLRADRKATYIRASESLLYGWDDFVRAMNEHLTGESNV